MGFEKAGDNQVRDFFRGRCVFLTGATGFLGKGILEKLCRSTQVSSVLVLIRESKQKCAQLRLQELLSDSAFDRVRSERPQFHSRIQVLSGDCSLPNLGLSDSDLEKTMNRADVFVHAAATVNFNEPLGRAYDVNVQGTRNVLQLAKRSHSLKSFVYISTAYSNCIYKYVEERIYTIPTATEHFNYYDANIEKEILGLYPNTYCFTKALAECCVQELGKGLPVVVFRPGIVISSYKEPEAGWIDNLYGPAGIVAAALSGVLRVALVGGRLQANLVPVDMCVNAILAAAASAERGATPTPLVYNYTCPTQNSITWDEYGALSELHSTRYPYSRALWKPLLVRVGDATFYRVLCFWLHVLPAALVDVGLLVLGRKRTALKLYRKLHKQMEVLQYFCTQDWHFELNNAKELWQCLGEEDKREFPFNMEDVRWVEYFRGYIGGIRRHLLKDGDASEDGDGDSFRMRRAKFLNVLHNICRVFFDYIVISMVLFIVNNII